MMHHLTLEVDYSFYTLGISCHAKEYKMAWMINKALGLDLEYQDPLVLKKVKSLESQHSLYQCAIEDDRINVSLIANRSKSGLLLPEFPQTDFILKVEEAEEEEFREIRDSIKAIKQVLLVHSIDPNQLKSRTNLIF